MISWFIYYFHWCSPICPRLASCSFSPIIYCYSNGIYIFITRIVIFKCQTSSFLFYFLITCYYRSSLIYKRTWNCRKILAIYWKIKQYVRFIKSFLSWPIPYHFPENFKFIWFGCPTIPSAIHFVKKPENHFNLIFFYQFEQCFVFLFPSLVIFAVYKLF
ncbi:MAG: hypothetical protein ACD_4C00312G0005 [uncultured bacterium (gcode 4)]|uniref:Uncharacterized protein n=1 Tax=uncultured bacterium (gcode 4) TaxID=1234023 RepID=K2FTW0_9BACT|nr:MAG: hypothetical protein ACD_4C00312G0005 [uncultured bacterium (gcode 4)]